MRHELATHISDIDKMALNPVAEWINHLKMVMYYDMRCIEFDASTHADPKKYKAALKKRNGHIAAMEALEATYPIVTKLKLSAKKKPNPGWKMLAQLEKKWKKQQDSYVNH